jgi:hypothetical protein
VCTYACFPTITNTYLANLGVSIHARPSFHLLTSPTITRTNFKTQKHLDTALFAPTCTPLSRCVLDAALSLRARVFSSRSCCSHTTPVGGRACQCVEWRRAKSDPTQQGICAHEQLTNFRADNPHLQFTRQPRDTNARAARNAGRRCGRLRAVLVETLNVRETSLAASVHLCSCRSRRKRSAPQSSA